MKLPDDVRARLRAGETVTHTFSARVRRDNVYVIQTGKGTPQGHFRVIQCVEADEGWKALLVLEGDPIRIPAKESGYTDFSGRAMARGDEPGPELEAVDEETQAEFTKRASEAAQAKREDAKRLRKLEYIQRKARRSNFDLTPLTQMIDEEVNQIEKRLQEQPS